MPPRTRMRALPVSDFSEESKLYRPQKETKAGVCASESTLSTDKSSSATGATKGRTRCVNGDTSVDHFHDTTVVLGGDALYSRYTRTKPDFQQRNNGKKPGRTRKVNNRSLGTGKKTGKEKSASTRNTLGLLSTKGEGKHNTRKYKRRKTGTPFLREEEESPVSSGSVPALETGSDATMTEPSLAFSENGSKYAAFSCILILEKCVVKTLSFDCRERK